MNKKLATGAAIAALAFSMSACANSEQASNTPSGSPAAPTTDAGMSTQAPTGGGDAANGVTTAADTFGPACSQLPQGNAPGGLTSMGPQPLATAASTNPLLTKLVAAVGAVPGLADTLNTTDNLTVFAPADPAFDALGAAKFQELAANPSQLAPILQFHVVPKRYDAEGLQSASAVQSLNGSAPELKIEGSGDNMTVNGAKVLCGNIPTKNATVFVIDTVMVPKG